MEDKYLIALEIGSSKIKAALGIIGQDGVLTIKAIEEENLPHGEVRYGHIRNVAVASQAVADVLKRLEQREPLRKVTGIYVGIGGRSLRSDVESFSKRLPHPTEISGDLLREMVSDAYHTPMLDRDIVDVTQREFRIDNDPTQKLEGSYGQDIQAKFNVISCRTQLLRNLRVVLDEQLKMPINGIMVRQIAEADLVLTNEERRLGCMLVDLGADTTTVSIYKEGVLCHLATLPIGSAHITRDLIKGMNYLDEHAEELKIIDGNAIPGKEINPVINRLGEDISEVNRYVSARVGEIIANILEQTKVADIKPEAMPGGIILVGKGAKLTNFLERLQTSSGMTIRMGIPTRIRIADNRVQPYDAVDVISLLDYAAHHAPKECMSRPKIEVTSANDDPYTIKHPVPPSRPKGPERRIPEFEDTTKKPYKPEKEKEKKKSTSRKMSTFWGHVKERVADIMSEKDD